MMDTQEYCHRCGGYHDNSYLPCPTIKKDPYPYKTPATRMIEMLYARIEELTKRVERLENDRDKIPTQL